MALLRVVIVLCSLGLAMAAYFRLFGTPFVDLVSRWTASSTAQVLNLFGASVSTSGTVVGSSGFAYTIVPECTVIGPVLLFAGAVVAYPATLQSKVLGIGMGLVLLALLNLVRLVSLYYIGVSFPEYLPMAHYLVWQAAIIIFAIVVWLLWVEKFTRRSYG